MYITWDPVDCRGTPRGLGAYCRAQYIHTYIYIHTHINIYNKYIYICILHRALKIAVVRFQDLAHVVQQRQYIHIYIYTHIYIHIYNKYIYMYYIGL